MAKKSKKQKRTKIIGTKGMNKLISVLLVAISLFAVACIFSSCSKEEEVALSFDENIVGTWQSQKDGSKNKATICFENKDGELKGNQRFYDYDNSEWGEMSFAVGDRTKYTITLLFDDGTMKTVSYSVGKNTLIFDNVIYKNDSKNIPVDTDVETYMVDGIPMPVRAGIYFGMSKSEVKLIADTEYKYKLDATYTNTELYELPDFFTPQVNGYTSYDFDDNEKLISHGFSFYGLRSSDDEKLIELKKNILYVYSEMYGDYHIFEWTTDVGTVSYTFVSGNMGIEVIVWKDHDITIEYSLDIPDYKLGIE